MKIWIFNHYAVPIKYYPHGRPHWLAQRLVKDGHQVSVFAASTVHNSDRNLIKSKEKRIITSENGIEYVFLRTTNYTGNGYKRIWNMIEYMNGLCSIYKQFEKPDIIFAMSAHPLTCIAGLIISKKVNCRCVVDIADLWPESFVSYGIIGKNNPLLKVMYMVEKKIYMKADEIIFTMPGGHQYIIDKKWDLDIEREKIHYINNGVNLEDFKYNRNNYQIKDEDLDDEEHFKVVYVGSIRKVNNINKIVDCAQILQNMKSKSKILIYGDGDERETLIEKVKLLNLTNIVFKGFIEKKFVPYVLSKCNICLLHGGETPDIIIKYGYSTNKIFDYLAAGKPIISDLESKYDIIMENGCGLTLNKCTEQELADAIVKFEGLSDKEYLTYCNNSKFLSKQFDSSVMTGKIEEVLFRSVFSE